MLFNTIHLCITDLYKLKKKDTNNKDLECIPMFYNVMRTHITFKIKR